jgi:cyclin-dependent kinase 12/13
MNCHTLQQPTHSSSKSTCEQLNPEDDSVPGFRVEPPRPLETSSVHQDSECGSTWSRVMGDSAVPGRVCNSVHVGNPYTSRKKGFSHSNIPQFGAVDLRNGVDSSDQNQPSDGPVPSQSNDQEEVSSIIILKEHTILNNTVLFHLISHIYLISVTSFL